MKNSDSDKKKNPFKAAWRYIKGNKYLMYWYKLFKNTVLDFGGKGGLLFAAGISFFALFALFPLLLLGISIIGFKLSHPEAINTIINMFHRLLPGQADVLIKNARTIAQDRGKIGIAGLVILIWVSRGLFLAMEYSVNRLWGASTRRSVLGRNLVAVTAIFLLVLIAASSMVLSTVIAYLTKIKVPILNISLSQLSFYGSINRWFFSTLLIFTIFLVLYKILPHCKTSFSEIAPGALFSTILWKLAELVYIYYMSNMARFSEFYGSLAGLLGLMLWFYIAAIIFLLGAKFNVVRLKLHDELSIHCETD